MDGSPIGPVKAAGPQASAKRGKAMVHRGELPTELSPEQLRLTCPPAELGFATTDQLCHSRAIIGQQRAQESIEFGLRIRSYGYNIFALGAPGTGKATKIHEFLKEEAEGKPVPGDWVYVTNFDNSNAPNAICLPPGRARQFTDSTDELIRELKKAIPRAFEDREYLNKKKEIAHRFEEQRNALIEEENQWAHERGYTVIATPAGLVMLPVKDGQPMSREDFEKLPQEEREAFSQATEEFQSRIEEAMGRAREIEREMKNEVAELDRTVAAFAVGHLIDDVARRFKDVDEVGEHLEHVRADILDNIGKIRHANTTGEEEEGKSPMAQMVAKQAESVFDSYGVNCVVDNSGLEGAPVVYEMSPTYANLMGRIGQRMEMGAIVSDFRQVRPGALHRANGGYLLLDAKDVLTSPLAWDALKRALKNRQIRTEDVLEQFRIVTGPTIEPEPIPLDLKVVLMGAPQLYYILAAMDEDFPKLFKVKADFDSQMPRSGEEIAKYGEFLCTRCHEEGLRPFDASAVARIVEYGSRLVEDQRKLSARFSDIADLAREADYWAAAAGNDVVSSAHVAKAIEHKIYRSNRIEERVREMIEDGSIMVDTTGVALGQVNGLSVVSLGDYAFGRPSRITATVAIGRGNVIDIEREVNLAGPIHSKGVLILSGYLAENFAKDVPLSIAARLCFEQSYEGVEGDSASCAELYALLSAIAGLPLRQDLAVTGSVNQKGQVQAIGGAIYKIEGYFDVCRAKGLTGTQGVMIPVSNVLNLMLRDDVIEAVRDGKFHIYSVETIEQGFSLLTGVPAGRRGDDGRYPDGSGFARVDAALRQMAECQRRFIREEGGRTGDNPSEGEP
jgi:lon-related putative ATP-dependent protease